MAKLPELYYDIDCEGRLLSHRWQNYTHAVSG